MAAKRKNENGQNRAGPAALYTVALIAVALGVLALSSLLLPHFERELRAPPGSPSFPPDIGDYPLVRFALSAVNILLVVYLLFIHVRDYLRLKSSFTLGLVIFLFSFLLYALSSFPVLHMLLGEGGRAEFLSFVPMIFTTIGLLVFAKLSSD